MDKKKLIMIGSVIAIIVSVVAIIFLVTKKDTESEYKIDGIDLPENKEILKDQTIADNIEISNISLLTRDGISSYKATIKNTSDKDIKIKTLYVIFYENDIENKTLALYDTNLVSQKEQYISIKTETDLTNTTKIEYVLE